MKWRIRISNAARRRLYVIALAVLLGFLAISLAGLSMELMSGAVRHDKMPRRALVIGAIGVWLLIFEYLRRRHPDVCFDFARRKLDVWGEAVPFTRVTIVTHLDLLTSTVFDVRLASGRRKWLFVHLPWPTAPANHAVPGVPHTRPNSSAQLGTGKLPTRIDEPFAVNLHPFEALFHRARVRAIHEAATTPAPETGPIAHPFPPESGDELPSSPAPETPPGEPTIGPPDVP